MSFLGKKWILQHPEDHTDLIQVLLTNRQLYTPEEHAAFFDDSIQGLHDPLLLKDMPQAVERVRQAIDKKEKIMIFGDYDVDGISGTAILYDFLKSLGADVHYTLPHREKDGYGPKEYFIRQFAQDQVKLIITVDCGTSALKEITLANELGMDVIVTDHHSMPAVLPPAVAVVNPQRADCDYPNTELSGSAMAWKLMQAVAPHYLNPQQVSQLLYKQLGVASLGLVADCMPLLGENRLMVKHGLKSLEHADHPGLKVLLQGVNGSSSKLTSQTIGFVISPRLNAAGRMETPNHALELLLGDIKKAELLHQLNYKRRELVDRLVAEAKEEIKQMGRLPLVIVLHKTHWPAGILGLIASQLVEAYGRPAIVMQNKDGKLVASCRSLNDFDITQFLRSHMGELFLSMGGHAQAGGFTLAKENLAEFKKRVTEFAPQYIDPALFFGALSIECALSARHLNLKTKSQIDQLEPFGYSNPEPLFLIPKAKLTAFRFVGEKENHLQLDLSFEGQALRAIAFNFGKYRDKIKVDAFYDVVCTLDVNEWNGKKNLQLKVVDLSVSQ